MKKMMYLTGMMLVPFALMAQEATPEGGELVVNVNTFTGMMALVTVVVTWIATRVPYIATHKWAKMLAAVGVGLALTMACWALQVSDYLLGLTWWQALVAGAAVGLSAAGFYDVVRAVWSVFNPKTKTDGATK